MKILTARLITIIIMIFNYQFLCECCGCCKCCKTRTLNDNIDEEHIKKIKSKKSKKSKKDEKDKKLKNNKTDKKGIHIINDKKNGNLSIIKEESEDKEKDEIKITKNFTITITTHTIGNTDNNTDSITCNVEDIEGLLDNEHAIKYGNEYYTKSTCNNLLKILINDHNNNNLKDVYLYDYSKDEKIKLNITKTVEKKDIEIEATNNAPIILVKELFSQKEGIPIWQQRLTFRMKQLEDNKTIESYNINANDTINYLYNKPRNNTHKSKK